MIGSSFSTCCHSNDFFEPVTSKLSRYCRAVSNRLRVTSAHTSEPLIVKVAVSMANGLLYFLISSSRMRPEPWHVTLSASAGLPGFDRIARHGLTQWVAYHIGGRPGQ